MPSITERRRLADQLGLFIAADVFWPVSAPNMDRSIQRERWTTFEGVRFIERPLVTTQGDFV
jgi:hypothetical protein